MIDRSSFSDARTLYDRAQTHRAEFNKAQGSPAPWGLKISRDEVTREFVYALHLDREALRRLEPIAADTANNLIHALDQVVGGWARIGSTTRPRIYYPVALDEGDFERGLAAIAPHIPSLGVETIRQVRQEQVSVLEHVALVKELSNTAKHWKLVATEFTAHAIGVAQSGNQDFTNVPSDHFLHNDSFEFMRSPVPPDPQIGYQVVLGLRFGGLRNSLICDPATALRCASQFVEAAITESEIAARTSA